MSLKTKYLIVCEKEKHNIIVDDLIKAENIFNKIVKIPEELVGCEDIYKGCDFKPTQESVLRVCLMVKFVEENKGYYLKERCFYSDNGSTTKYSIEEKKFNYIQKIYQ